MKIVALNAGLVGAALTCLSAPAFAQTACETGREVAKKAFVEPFNAANAAMAGQNYADALQLVSLARPHALSAMQQTAVTQIEAAAYVGLDNRAAATAAMKLAIADRCLSSDVRAKYLAKLGEWGVPAN